MLHIRLRGETVNALKKRATTAGIAADDYLELVLWYATLEFGKLRMETRGVTMDEEELYFSAPASTPLRARLEAHSAEQGKNLASYTGLMVEHYFRAFERDPGDFRMFARFSALLDSQNLLTEHHLLEVLRLLPGSPVSRMPAGFQTQWIYQRFRPFLKEIRTDAGPADLTVESIRSLLERACPREN